MRLLRVLLVCGLVLFGWSCGKKVHFPELVGMAATTAASTNEFNPDGYYGAYEPMTGASMVRPAITVSKFVTGDSVASMGLVRPRSVGLFGPESNLLAVCVGSNWWWYADLPVGSVPTRCFFRFDGYYTYWVNDVGASQYRIYPVVGQ